MAKAALNSQVTQWATFKLDKELYGIDVMSVQEVLRYTEITPVPGAPHFVLGIINLRGNVVTIIDTRSRFGLGPFNIDDNSRIIIVEIQGQVLGLLVDSVAEVVYVEDDEVEKTPNVGNEESSKYIQGVSNKSGELLILVSLEAFVNLGSFDAEFA